MKVVMGNRRSGKTAWAIELSVKTGKKIVLPSDYQKRMVIEMAKEMGFNDFPEPISLTSFPYGHKEEVILDNAEYYLKSMMRSQYGLEIDSITMTSDSITVLEDKEDK